MNLAPPDKSSSWPQPAILPKQPSSGSELTQKVEDTGSIGQLSKGSLSLQALAARKLVREQASRQVFEALHSPELEQARLTVDLIPALTQNEIVGLSLLNDCLPRAAQDLPASPLAKYANAPHSATTASEIRDLLPSCGRELTLLVSLCLKAAASRAAHRASRNDSAPECDRAQRLLDSIGQKIHEWLEGYEIAGSALATDESSTSPELRPEDQSMVQTFVRSQRSSAAPKASRVDLADSAAARVNQAHAWYRDHLTFLLDKDRNPILSPDDEHGIRFDRKAQASLKENSRCLDERLVQVQEIHKGVSILLETVKKHRGPDFLQSDLAACLHHLNGSCQHALLNCRKIARARQGMTQAILLSLKNGPAAWHVAMAFHAVYVGDILPYSACLDS